MLDRKIFDCIFEASMESYIRNTINVSCDKNCIYQCYKLFEITRVKINSNNGDSEIDMRISPKVANTYFWQLHVFVCILSAVSYFRFRKNFDSVSISLPNGNTPLYSLNTQLAILALTINKASVLS